MGTASSNHIKSAAVCASVFGAFTNNIFLLTNQTGKDSGGLLMCKLRVSGQMKRGTLRRVPRAQTRNAWPPYLDRDAPIPINLW